MKGLCLIASVLALSLTFTERAAADITYFANDTVGIGSVTGTIVTDGVLGILGTSDIVSFNLTLNDGTGTATLVGPGATDIVSITGNNVTATSTALEFDFNGNGSFMNFFDVNTCSPPEWSFETTGSGIGCNGTTGNEEGVAAVDPYGSGTYSPESGEVVFATATTTTPEPSYLGVMVIVFGVLGFIRTRKGYRKQSSQAA